MKTVLLIDDDAVFRKLMGKWLTGADWSVLEANDGEDGIRLAIERQPDAVICDLLMPRCNGFQVCRSIRERGGYTHQPKIIVTAGSGYATDQQNAMEVGADEYLVKPFNSDDLLRILERRSPRPTAAAAAPAPPPKAATRLPMDQPPRVKIGRAHV